MSSPSATLLCVGNFDRATGYAWDTIRRVWSATAAELEPYGVRTISVYRQPSQGNGIRSALPLDEIDDGWEDWNDLARLCETYDVDGCWLTDRLAVGSHYGQLRDAGARFIVVHERTSGERTAPRGVKRLFKSILARRRGWTADRYIAISEYVRRRLLATACLSSDRVTRVYNAIDLDHWNTPAEGGGVRERLGLDATVRLIVCTCRAQTYKGVDTLIDAVARMPEADADGRPIHAVHLGDGPDLQRFRAQIAAAGLRRRFHLRGRCVDVRHWIQDADVVAVPSRWQEAFGLAVAEGMAAGKPVVGTSVGAIPELIDDGETGLLVPPGDAEALAGGIGRLLDDSGLAERLGRQASTRAHEAFGMPRLASSMAEIFARGLGLKR